MVPFPDLVRTVLAAASKKRLGKLQEIAGEVLQYGSAQRYGEASEDALTQKFVEARLRADNDADGSAKERERKRYFEISLLAKIREAARRSVGMEPFPCQVVGALALRRGLIVQMDTGEGKTLSAAMSAICNAYAGKRTVVVTANDYLARRDAEWMGPLYERCGVSVAGVRETSEVSGKYSQYEQEVIYIANGTLIFDYLRSRSAISAWDDLPLSREVAVIDEIDNVLIDQASQTFTLSSSQEFSAEPFYRSERLIPDFEVGKDVEVDLSNNRVDFTQEGRAKVTSLASDLKCHPVEALFYLQAALKARYIFQRDRDYLVDQSGIVIIDDVSGRPVPGRRWEFGLQQAIEAKEGIVLSKPGKSTQSAGVSALYKNLFSDFSGLSGSAVHNAIELMIEYRKELVVVPPNKRCKRIDQIDLVYRTKPERNKSAAQEAVREASKGRPVLMGVTSIDEAHQAAEAVEAMGGSYELLTARNVDQEATIIAQAGTAGRITIADRIAGRGVDIKLDEEAKKAGGLHVIALGRSMDRRLDDQLRGRSGRQGDPGSSQFIVSLEDDLMKIFGGPKLRSIMLRLGMEQDVPIDSELVGRRIRAAQYAAVLNRYRQRQTRAYLDTAVFNAQRDLFQYRQRVLQGYRLNNIWADLLSRVEARLRAEPESIAPAIAVWKLALPEDLTFMVSQDPRSTVDEVMKFLRAAADKSLAACGDVEWNAYVKCAILRAVDSSWEEFLDEVRRGSEGLTMFSSSETTFERLSSLGRVLRAGRESAWARADQKAVENILCGQGLFGSFSSFLSAQDAQQLLNSGPADKPLLEKSQGEIDGFCWKLAFAPQEAGDGATLAEYAQGYREFLLTNEGPVATLPQSLKTIKEFERFLAGRPATGTLESARRDFLARKRAPESRGISRLFASLTALARRRFERSELWDFGEHLHLQGVIKLDTAQLVGWKEAAISSNEVLRRMALPVLWLKLGYIVLFAVLFRLVSLVSFEKTPALASAIMSRLGFTNGVLPTTIDQLLLGGGLTLHGLGMLGLIPALLASWVMATIARNRVGMVHWLLSLPVTAVLLAVFTPWHQISSGEWLAWTATIAAVLGATTFITALAGIASVVEVLDAVMLTVLVNSWFALAAVTISGPLRPAQIGLRVAGLVAILGAYWLASRASQIKVGVEHAEVDAEGSVDLEVTEDELGIDIGSDGSQYWHALLVTGFADAVAHALGASALATASISLGVYLVALLVFQQWRIKTEFSTESVMHFLDSHNSRLPDSGGGPAKLAARLGNGVRKLFALDVLLCGVIAGFAYTSEIASVSAVPYVVGVTMLWGVLTNRLLRQMQSAMAGNTLAQAIRIPLLVETADEDKPLWRKATDYVLRLQTSAVGALLVLYGIFEMVQKVWETFFHTAKH